jgi:lysophospholipase L1-like esterase
VERPERRCLDASRGGRIEFGRAKIFRAAGRVFVRVVVGTGLRPHFHDRQRLAAEDSNGRLAADNPFFHDHLAAEPQRLGELAREISVKGVNTVVINSNDLVNFPQDGPLPMRDFAQEYGWDFPYLIDESQTVAKSYGAACTPDFFLFNAEGRLSYAGQFDGARPGSGENATGDDLRDAAGVMLAGKAPKKGVPSSGCSIKWKPGNEPRWFR